MAENEEEVAVEEEAADEPTPDDEPTPVDEPEVVAKDEEQNAKEIKSASKTSKTSKTSKKDALPGQPPAHPMPPGIGEGVPMKSGGRQESILSSSPLTDPELLEEMKKADERCTVIMKEIEELKTEILDLMEKKELSEEDTELLQSKQDELLMKMAEVEQITRKLQSMLGLTDLSSMTFSKMFEMLPYPHTKPCMSMEEEETKPRPEDLFDLPQIEYPEDKLPRVIVCGHTEDEIPKIVVADSKKRGQDRSLKNLTGKLTESLTMQEKLVLENAQLEGGKYKLEEALLEKDSAVESLQRKVCGLQAEMRIVVKENTELSRQLACLNQRITSPCCYPCPGGNQSPGSSPSPFRSFSYTTTVQQDDDYCQCKCCLQLQFPDTPSPHGNTLCMTRNSQTYLNSGDSPRLAGGASRSGLIVSGASSQADEMCCRSPAVTKQPCPPPPPRGTCPEELEHQLASYSNNSKQLEQQLGNIECEIRNMQIELANVQRERQQLEQQRKLLKCTGPCAPCGCCPPPPSMSLQTSGSPSYVPPAPILPPPSIPLPKVSVQYLDQLDCASLRNKLIWHADTHKNCYTVVG